MPFPDSPRVIYKQNPLVEVICQIRFPSILRIDSELPSQFQERVKESYPLFEENQGADVKLNLAPEISKIIGTGNPISLRSGRTAYDFVSEDGTRKVGLTRDFLALSTTSYERWEAFRGNLTLPLNALIDVYGPNFYTRIGLRYRDLICRSKLGLENFEWAQLLQPQVSGELGSPEVGPHIDHAVREIGIRLNDGVGRVIIRHGLVEFQEGERVEICYLIDSDIFTDQKTEVNNALEVLDTFHRQSGRLFRWCITDRLHSAMAPHPI